MQRAYWNIGLTGGIGCGKSAAGELLEDLGLARLDTDRVAREVVAPGSPGLASVVGAFGPAVLDAEGAMDRAQMGRIVFADPDARARLEEILHPLIWSRVRDFMRARNQEGKSTVVEVPLLFENERQDEFDEVWVVSATPELQFQRLQARNGWSEEEIRARLDSQMPLQEKIARAHRVFDNSQSLSSLRARLDSALSALALGEDRR